MDERESAAMSRFACSPAERACFEAGIKLATVYHQFVGTPFCRRNAADLERTIAECIEVQPYVESAEIHIRPTERDKKDQYSYESLTGNMIDAVVKIAVEGTEVTAEMRYDSELDYPLMYISGVRSLRCGLKDFLTWKTT